MQLRFVALTLLAFLAGALAWAIPPHAFGKIIEHYPETTWPWLGDAIWNALPFVSLPLIFAIGFIYGMINPRFFWISFFATEWVVPFNVVLDVYQYPTSHNLWPFEVTLFGVMNLPALIGAWLGKLAAQRLAPRHS